MFSVERSNLRLQFRTSVNIHSTNKGESGQSVAISNNSFDSSSASSKFSRLNFSVFVNFQSFASCFKISINVLKQSLSLLNRIFLSFRGQAVYKKLQPLICRKIEIPLSISGLSYLNRHPITDNLY